MHAAQIAIRKMLRDDNSNAVMLLFGYIGFLNAACLAPVLLILHFSGTVRVAGLTARVIGLTVCKGGACTDSPNTNGAAITLLHMLVDAHQPVCMSLVLIRSCAMCRPFRQRAV